MLNSKFQDFNKLNSFLVSKICHDFASPLSAIGIAIESIDCLESYKKNTEFLLECFDSLKVKLQITRLIFSLSANSSINWVEATQLLVNYASLKKIDIQSEKLLYINISGHLVKVVAGLVVMFTDFLPKQSIIELDCDNLGNIYIATNDKYCKFTTEFLYNSMQDFDDTRSAFLFFLNQLSLKNNYQIVYEKKAEKIIVKLTRIY
jgi:hypothetical protein